MYSRKGYSDYQKKYIYIYIYILFVVSECNTTEEWSSVWKPQLAAGDDEERNGNF